MMYILQVTIYTGLMLLIYLLLLRDSPLHRYNRMFLLLSAVLPMVLPVLKLPENINVREEGDFLMAALPDMLAVASRETEQLVLPSWTIILMIIYIVVAMVLGIAKIIGYIRMRIIIAKGEKEIFNGYVVVKHTGYGPGSWGRYIFLPEGTVDAMIIEHELEHVRLNHSLDIVMLACLQVLMWPNLFLYLVKKELVQVHEFQADAAVNMDSEAYARLILSSVFKTRNFQLAHLFNNHPIKRRIMMLKKNKIPAGLIGFFAAGVTIVIIFKIVAMQSCQTKQDIKSKPTETTHKTGVFSYVHKMPEADYDVYEFLGAHITYPKEAKEKNIEGRVIVTFIIDKTGKITNIDYKNKDIDALLANAAMKTVAQMPDWTPGEDEKGNKVAVFMTLPISFWLDNDDTEKTSKTNEDRIIEWHAFGEDAEEPKKTSSAADALDKQWRWKYNDYQHGVEFGTGNHKEGC